MTTVKIITTTSAIKTIIKEVNLPTDSTTSKISMTNQTDNDPPTDKIDKAIITTITITSTQTLNQIIKTTDPCTDKTDNTKINPGTTPEITDLITTVTTANHPVMKVVTTATETPIKAPADCTTEINLEMTTDNIKISTTGITTINQTEIQEDQILETSDMAEITENHRTIVTVLFKTTLQQPRHR